MAFLSSRATLVRCIHVCFAICVRCSVVSHFGSEPFREQKKTFTQMLEEEQYFLAKTVDDLMKFPRTNKNEFHPIPAGYSAFAVVEALARERGLHRVPVVTPERAVVNLITQSSVIRWLADNIQIIGDLGNKPIAECHRLFKEV